MPPPVSLQHKPLYNPKHPENDWKYMQDKTHTNTGNVFYSLLT